MAGQIRSWFYFIFKVCEEEEEEGEGRVRRRVTVYNGWGWFVRGDGGCVTYQFCGGDGRFEIWHYNRSADDRWHGCMRGEKEKCQKVKKR